MTFADLRALHALIGVAIDDIERIYRPQQRSGSRHASQTSGRPTPVSSPAPTTKVNSSCSSSTTDSDADESGDTDISMPPTPVSPVYTSSPSNNNVRFANGNGRVKKGRDRAHTVSAVSSPPIGSSPATMPPPILKQPPLDWPSLDIPMPVSASSPPEVVSLAQATPSPSYLTVPSTPSPSPVTPPQQAEQSALFPPRSPHTPHIPASNLREGDNEKVSPCSTRRASEMDVSGETPRQKEWKKKCEDLTSHPEVINAVNRIVAACGQMAAMVQKPFLTMCDAAMGYHLPACLRFLEASHIVEILRDAGPQGLHVDTIAKCISSGNVYGGEDVLDSNKLSHILRLLATHHIGREVRADVFANNRLSSVIDSGKHWKDLMRLVPGGKDGPEKKYEDTDGAAAFVGLCTDELFKASAFLTDCYLYPLSSQLSSPIKPSFVEDNPGTIPPVPPLPVPASVDDAHQLGMHTPNDSTNSLLGPMARLRKKKSEMGLALHLGEAIQSHTSDPMTFAQNSLHGSPTSLSSSAKSHKRKHSRNASFASDLTGSDVPGTPPPPPTPSRPGILKRLSNRSMASKPEIPKSPLPLISSVTLAQPPNIPRSPMSRSISSQSLTTAAYTSFGTPKSNPAKEENRFMDAGMGDLLSTPKSNPRGAREREMATPKSTPNKQSLTSSAMTSLTMSVTGDRRKTSPTTPKSPLVSRKHNVPTVPTAHAMNDDSSLPSQSGGQGLLGPAFDLQPPAMASSPRSRTFSESLPSSPVPPFHESIRKYASPIPPPIPAKSSLRSLRSAASASSTSLASLNDKHARKASGKSVTEGSEMYAPFNVAFNTKMRYFEWLEKSENTFRLRRFGKAMTGTAGWEVPGSVVTGFPWHELPRRSVVVDVGGGIGSTSMLLANAFPHLRFIVQDRAPVVEMGRAAWRSRCPELLDSGRAAFQAHDFFKPQPSFPVELNCGLTSNESESASEMEGYDIRKAPRIGKCPNPAVFLMRVITHDWPDSYVTRILLRLRQAAGPNTRLVLADFVLPLACVDDVDHVDLSTSQDIGNNASASKSAKSYLPGTVRTLAPEGSCLLPNLGKASAHAYWLDLTMRAMFNSQERTLREFCTLTLATGWKITQVIRAEGSIFGHLTAVPIDIPDETLRSPVMTMQEDEEPSFDTLVSEDSKQVDMGRSPPLNDTFLSSVDLPSEAVIRQSILSGFIKMNSRRSTEPDKSKRRGRERSSTFTGQRNAPGRDGKTGEVRKGFRTLMRMLSKPQLRGGEGSPSSVDRA